MCAPGDKASIANEINCYFTNIFEQIGHGKENCTNEFDNTKLRSFVSSRLNADTTFHHG